MEDLKSRIPAYALVKGNEFEMAKLAATLQAYQDIISLEIIEDEDVNA